MSEQRHTIRCAVYVFLIQDNKLFLLRRKNTGWQDGKYGVPAGHLEANEMVLDAAVREVREEAGITVKKETLMLVHTMHRKGSFEYLDLFFTASKWEGDPFAAEEALSDDAQWISLDRLPENMIPNQKLAVKHYQEHILFSEIKE